MCLWSSLQFITEGYAAHLSQLEYNHRSRPAKSSTARMVLRKGSFGLGANSDFLRKRNHLLRTISSQPAPSSPTGSIHNRPERTQSQSDSERLERERMERAQSQGATQRSMSITASCWGRSSSTKLEPGPLSPKWDNRRDNVRVPSGEWLIDAALGKRHVTLGEMERGQNSLLAPDGLLLQAKSQVLQTTLYKN